MTITIDLTPTEEAQLIQAAKQEGMEPEAFIKKLVTNRPTQSIEATFADILAPIHSYSREQGYGEEEIGAFVDAEVDVYRAERHARLKAHLSE